mmetsp:Transcript_17129/g.35743  ORF Transcript_17129/g.35743 Transcript_17129/m.35743 type:complete len:240 (-) Transcript_17129:169-888(-)
MSNEIRRRNAPRSPPENEMEDLNLSYDESRLSANALMAASPIHSGPVMKMHVPAIFSFLPSPIQWLLTTRCCPKIWAPQWKPRFLIALGGYLYRFKDENGSSPKGAPTPLDVCSDCRIITREDDEYGEFNAVTDCVPDGYNVVFEVSSVGKTQYFAVESREEALTWVNSLRQGQQDVITRNMGHSKIPYPKEWTAFDASAKRLRDQKLRIKQKLEQLDKKEQEMQTMGAGGSIGGGYYS